MSPQPTKNVVHAPDGSVHEFPSDATPEEMDAALSSTSSGPDNSRAQLPIASQVGKVGPSGWNSIRNGSLDFLRYIIPPAGAIAASAATASTGVGMGAAPTAGMATFAGLDTLLKQFKSNPGDLSENLKDSALSAVVNEVGGRVLGRLLKGGKALLNSDVPDAKSILNFSPTSSQALKAEGAPILGAVTKGFEDLALTAKQKALDRTAGAGFTQAIQMSKNAGFDLSRNPTSGRFMNPLEPYGQLTSVNQAMSPVANEGFANLGQLDKIIADPRALESTLSTAQANGIDTPVKKTLQQYQFAKMFNQAATRDVNGNPATGNVVRINSTNLNDSWYDPEMQKSLKTLYNSNQRADIQQFFKNVEATQDKISINPIARKFWMMHGAVGLATTLFTGSVTAGAESALLSGGILIGAEGVGKLLTNPKTARLMVALAGQEPLGVSEQFAGRMISKVLSGTVVGLSQSDGTVKSAKLEDGKLVPLQ